MSIIELLGCGAREANAVTQFQNQQSCLLQGACAMRDILFKCYIALPRHAMWTERANAVPCQWALHRRPRPVSVLALVALNTSLHIILVTVQAGLSWDQGTHGYLEAAPGLLSRELSN